MGITEPGASRLIDSVYGLGVRGYAWKYYPRTTERGY
jgi:hypothetical protein